MKLFCNGRVRKEREILLDRIFQSDHGSLVYSKSQNAQKSSIEPSIRSIRELFRVSRGRIGKPKNNNRKLIYFS